MKDVIRCGVFETNSSSEHSLILMKSEDYRAWVDGKAMARLLKIEESKKTSGNFWSSRLEIEFTYDIESTKNENTIKAKNHAKAEIEGFKTYREKVVNYAKEDSGSYEMQFDHRWTNADEDWYNRRMKQYNDVLDSDDPVSKLDCWDKFENGLWITYDEFWKAFTEESDCYSPFEHDDGKLNVHVIGKYFHS